MRAAKWFFANWYWFNGAVAIIAAIYLAAAWGDLSVIQRIMLGQFIVLNLHFLEEFRLPGGFGMMGNIVEKHSEQPDRYPLNHCNACLGNNWFALVVYPPAIFLPDVTWLTLSVTMFGFLEVLGHLGVFNILLKIWYNPGLATSIFGFLPLSVTYLVYMYSNGNHISWWLYLVALAYPIAHYLIVFHVVLMRPPFARRDTQFPFTDADVARSRPFIKNVWPYEPAAR